jgi:hypothetical protein
MWQGGHLASFRVFFLHLKKKTVKVKIKVVMWTKMTINCVLR